MYALPSNGEQKGKLETLQLDKNDRSKPRENGGSNRDYSPAASESGISEQTEGTQGVAEPTYNPQFSHLLQHDDKQAAQPDLGDLPRIIPAIGGEQPSPLSAVRVAEELPVAPVSPAITPSEPVPYSEQVAQPGGLQATSRQPPNVAPKLLGAGMAAASDQAMITFGIWDRPENEAWPHLNYGYEYDPRQSFPLGSRPLYYQAPDQGRPDLQLMSHSRQAFNAQQPQHLLQPQQQQLQQQQQQLSSHQQRHQQQMLQFQQQQQLQLQSGQPLHGQFREQALSYQQPQPITGGLYTIPPPGTQAPHLVYDTSRSESDYSVPSSYLELEGSTKSKDSLNYYSSADGRRVSYEDQPLAAKERAGTFSQKLSQPPLVPQHGWNPSSKAIGPTGSQPYHHQGPNFNAHQANLQQDGDIMSLESSSPSMSPRKTSTGSTSSSRGRPSISRGSAGAHNSEVTRLTGTRQTDEHGIPWIIFDYPESQAKKRMYRIRCDIETIDTSSFDEDFRNRNCVYPKAMVPPELYSGHRQEYETKCNEIGWKLVFKNAQLAGLRGLTQRAVDTYRNTSDASTRSRRARRMAKQRIDSNVAKFPQ